MSKTNQNQEPPPAAAPSAPPSLDTLREIGAELVRQDNACTAHPLFVVQQRRRIYGLDPQWSDDAPTWITNDGDCAEADEETSKALEAEYQSTHRERDGWTRTMHLDTWEFVTACLTRGAAERFIARQRHNLKDPRVYVESGYRNDEWIALRAELKALALRASQPAPVSEERRQTSDTPEPAPPPERLTTAQVLLELARWVRTPGNINPDDAVDECARLLENNARSFEALQASDHQPSVRTDAAFDGVKPAETPSFRPAGDEPGRMPPAPPAAESARARAEQWVTRRRADGGGRCLSCDAGPNEPHEATDICGIVCDLLHALRAADNPPAAPAPVREEPPRDPNRCAVCGWPLDPEGRMCRRGNCSQRPLPSRFYDPKRVAQEYGMYAPAETDPYVPPPDRAAQDRQAVIRWLDERIDHCEREKKLAERDGPDRYFRAAEDALVVLEQERAALGEDQG